VVKILSFVYNLLEVCSGDSSSWLYLPGGLIRILLFDLGQCYKTIAVIFHGNYCGKKTLLFLWLKYSHNLLSYCSNLLSFQGKFYVINIPMVIKSKMAVNYLSICFITLAPDVARPKTRLKYVFKNNMRLTN
jgi:hypothetical protein